VPYVESLEQTDRCRGGHGQDAVRCLHRAIPQRDFRIVDALDSQELETPDGSNDVEYRVDRSYFVKVQLVRRDAVYGALDCRDGIERRMRGARNFPYRSGDESPTPLARGAAAEYRSPL